MPYLRVSQPNPPPSVRPAMPVVELIRRRGQAESLGRRVEVGQRAPGSTRRAGAPDRRDAFSSAQIDHQAVIANRIARDVVAAAADRHEQIVVPSEVDRLTTSAAECSGRSAPAGDRSWRSRSVVPRRNSRPLEKPPLRGKSF